jgi:hypothetical protein
MLNECMLKEGDEVVYLALEEQAEVFREFRENFSEGVLVGDLFY